MGTPDRRIRANLSCASLILIGALLGAQSSESLAYNSQDPKARVAQSVRSSLPLADQTSLEELAAQDDMRPAEQVYKNIQVFTGMPASRLVVVMKKFTSVLGVRCEHCHVTAPGSTIPGFGAFSKDDLEAKRTARKMVLMVKGIQSEYFEGSQGPTCWTCHRGSVHPEFDSAPIPATDKPAADPH